MKFLQTTLIAGLCLARLHALEPAAVSAVAKQFDLPSGDEQYQARVELNRLVDEATLPGQGNPAAVTTTLLAVLDSADSSVEARKYILRALSRIATAEAIAPLAKILDGPDPLLKEEAREALSWIRDPQAAAALEAALRKSTEKADKLSLVTALATQGSASSLSVIAPFMVDADADTARAALFAASRIGGPPAVEILGKALASPRLVPALKADAENALLIASAGDARIAGAIFQSTASDTARLTAFLAIMETGADPAVLETALKSDDAKLRHAALASGIAAQNPALVSILSQSSSEMPKEDRLVILSNIHQLKPLENAEKIAMSSIAAEDEDERISAITALAKIATKPAFEAVLQALGAREPRINQAAAGALGAMDYPAAESALFAMLKGDSSPDKVLAIKALLSRQLPDANAILLEIIKGNDDAASKEAMRSLYFTATLEDLKILCATSTEPDHAALRTSIHSICKRIATRLNTEEANDLVKSLD